MNFLDDRLPERFWSKALPVPDAGCWIWAGAQVWNGYGVFRHMGRAEYAHRISYEAANGAIANGLKIDHLCRVRCCVNPAHLDAVTQRENIRRGERGVEWGTDTHCRYGHAYTSENTAPRVDRPGGRACRECNRNKAAKCRASKEIQS